MDRTHRLPATAAVLAAAAALALSGCSEKQEAANPPESPAVTISPSESATPVKPATPSKETAPAESASPAAVKTAPAAAPEQEGDTKVYKFGDIAIRLTPNNLGVYTAIHILNSSRRSMALSITVRVTGPHGYAVTMQRDFPGVLPGESARDAGLLIDKDEAPVPADPVAEIVTFEQAKG